MQLKTKKGQHPLPRGWGWRERERERDRERERESNGWFSLTECPRHRHFQSLVPYVVCPLQIKLQATAYSGLCCRSKFNMYPCTHPSRAPVTQKTTCGVGEHPSSVSLHTDKGTTGGEPYVCLHRQGFHFFFGSRPKFHQVSNESTHSRSWVSDRAGFGCGLGMAYPIQDGCGGVAGGTSPAPCPTPVASCARVCTSSRTTRTPRT